MFIKHILERCGEIGIKIDAQIRKRWPFLDKQSKKIIHTQKPMGAVTIDVHACTCTNTAHYALIF